MTERRELALRIFDAPGGVVIACLCGAEAALIAPTIVQQWRGVKDPSAGALLRMTVHAKSCVAGQNLAVEQQQAGAGAR
jgi:hypothetical protein